MTNMLHKCKRAPEVPKFFLTSADMCSCPTKRTSHEDSRLGYHPHKKSQPQKAEGSEGPLGCVGDPSYKGTAIFRQGIDNGRCAPEWLCTSKAHYLLKVNSSCADGRLTWAEEWQSSQLYLDSNHTWITVKEQGFYLIYMQVTYVLRGANDDSRMSPVDLSLILDYRYAQGEQEFAAAFDTRPLMDKVQDAHLGNFLLLRLNAGEQVSVRAQPKERIKYNDIRPFSSYLTMVRYAGL
ncbi:uncharacterized protein LOC143519742 [Brachyhypopomus gauderio]|uniref:uncharacterized protein LOC143519742 n=1 Tax=Brachyhypopomus gauderio TaxID=698409 RepID=UPI004041348B